MLGQRGTFARGIDGEIARQFRIGWAPMNGTHWRRRLVLKKKVLDDVSRTFRNRRNRMQMRCRTRCVSDHERRWRPGAVGGRILPGSADPEVQELTRDTDLYEVSGVVWPQLGKGEIVRQNLAVVCEGYTDVIGFHRGGYHCGCDLRDGVH